MSDNINGMRGDRYVSLAAALLKVIYKEQLILQQMDKWKMRKEITIMLKNRILKKMTALFMGAAIASASIITPTSALAKTTTQTGTLLGSTVIATLTATREKASASTSYYRGNSYIMAFVSLYCKSGSKHVYYTDRDVKDVATATARVETPSGSDLVLEANGTHIAKNAGVEKDFYTSLNFED